MLTRREWMLGVGGCGAASLLPAATGSNWPQFRGPARDNISRETGLLRKFPAGGPKPLWSVPVAQGYAAAAIVSGRVYHHDYDEAKQEWLVNCRNLLDGKLLWQFREAREIRPNHAITRTVPAVDSRFVFSLDPKAVLHCLDIKTGKQLWRKSLVTDYQATIPVWYNGQCPLLEENRIVIATGGAAILAALDKATGKDIWRTPNPGKTAMSHSSVMPATLGGVKQYLYGTLKGPLGVSAEDGKLLWEFPRKFNVAVAPSPIGVSEDLVFMTGSYDAGSVMVRVRNAGGAFKAEQVFFHPFTTTCRVTPCRPAYGATVGVPKVGTSLRAARHNGFPVRTSNAARKEFFNTSARIISLPSAITGELLNPHCACGMT